MRGNGMQVFRADATLAAAVHKIITGQMAETTVRAAVDPGDAAAVADALAREGFGRASIEALARAAAVLASGAAQGRVQGL